MPNQRHADQRFVGVTLDVELGRAFEIERKRQGKSRSQFFREAIVEKLQRMGIKVDPNLAVARQRTSNLFDESSQQVAEEVNGPNTQIGHQTNFSSGASSKKYHQRRAKK